jgi:hypothetical protein
LWGTAGTSNVEEQGQEMKVARVIINMTKKGAKFPFT